ncbi:Aspartate aminotransferase, mitochondrial [Exophiala dermatitidis]
MSFFESAPLFPKDAIFALTAQYNNDASPVKVNLGQGSYRDENGLPWVLPSVREARRRVSSRKLDHEYLPILGLQNFRSAVGELVLGSEAYAAIGNRLATAQSLSGTGSLHLAGALIRNYSGLNRQIARLEFLYGRSRTAERRSIIVLYACAHNPTGCDPTKDQWREIGPIMKERELFPLFDAADLGFRSGNFDDDAFSIRYFVNDLGLECAVAISFAKSMGLYGERVGATILVTKSEKVARNCESVLERLQRSEISNPPAHGCKIATQILLDESLKRMWFEDLKTMSSRIEMMRERLCQPLVKNGALGTWDHIKQQSGMFGCLGLSKEVVLKLREQYHIYMADNSRISIAGLNESNVAYVAKAITHSFGG